MGSEKIGNFFGKAKNGFATVGNTIANKTKEIASVTNLSADKVQLERENKDLFLKLGKMVYAAKTVTEGAQLIIKTLDENTAKIADIDRQIQETTEQ